LAQIELGGVVLDVVKKDIKNVHLSVYPPGGRVRISAPLRMSLDTIRLFAISKLGWIKEQQRKIRMQDRETPREYLDRESHFVWGRRCLLKVVESDERPFVQRTQSTLLLTVRPGTPEAKKHAILENWYREEIKGAVGRLLVIWEPHLGVKVKNVFVQRMKTRWGSCNASAHNIRLNSELAKKPQECLEYILVHEMAHVIEPSHNARFIALMDRFIPQWRQQRQVLNATPLSHESWRY
jgi:predicted metal-dependent hydrolase